MTFMWGGLVGLFLLRLIKRHGWEYVPVILLALGAWWYLGSNAGLAGDGVLIAAVSGVHLITRKDMNAVLADR